MSATKNTTHNYLTTPDMAGLPDMAALLSRQRAAFMAEGTPPLELRQDRLDRAIDLLIRYQKPLCDAVSQDFSHRSAHQTLVTDIYASIEPLKHARKHVADWIRPERRKPGFPLNTAAAKAWVEYQPLGVVGVIAPWNFPIYLVFAPLAGILAAGNRALIKPSELTAQTTALMAEMFAEAYDPSEIAVISGDASVGAAFSALPFDHLLFTGSTSVGRHVMRAAAEHLVPVTLELGGKSPVIISRSADLRSAADKTISGKLLNAGQICLAPDYVFVAKEQRDTFVAEAIKATERRYKSLQANPDYTAIISQRHHARLLAMVDDARQKGAQIIEVNPAGESFAGGRKMPLMLILDPTEDMQCLQDEIFGPILPIRTYQDVAETIASVNRGPRPLALYWFGTDSAESSRIVARTTSGGVTLNNVVMHVTCEDLPFGGVGPSGMGTYHGRDGFKQFSHPKGVLAESRLDISAIMRPPYGALLERTLKLFIRR